MGRPDDPKFAKTAADPPGAGPTLQRPAHAVPPTATTPTDSGSTLLDPTLQKQPSGPSANLVGHLLDGRYRVLRALQPGGMGQVYAAHDERVDRAVAVKIMLDHSDPRRFRDEARIISRLRHPNTVRLFDYGEALGGRLYTVMELLDGRALNEVLANGARLPLSRTLEILLEVCRALEEAHVRGVIHRDLKPANIFLTQVGGDEVVKVLDFGIAKVAPDSTLAPQRHRTTTSGLIGTLAYMSPEQAKQEPVDRRSDFYSLGVIAFECLCGSPPFRGPKLVDYLRQHTHDLPPRPRDVAGQGVVDDDTEAFVMTLLAKDPASRPASATRLVAELKRLIHATHRAGPS